MSYDEIKTMFIKMVSFFSLIKNKYLHAAKAEEFLGADLRSLAVMRIGTALIIITDLVLRARDLVAFYTDQGILPRASLYGKVENPWFISLHFLGGTWQFEAALFLLAGLTAVCLLVGYRTKMATILSWFLLISLQARSLYLATGSDVLLRIILFWGLFLPWGKRFSLDQMRNPDDPKRHQHHIISIGTFALTAQIFFLYWFSFLSKLQPSWILNGNGVYYALNTDHFVTQFGIFLRQFPTVMSILSYLVLFFEGIGPLLLLSPIASGPVRTITIFVFIGMHAGFGTFMTLALFPWISSIAMLGLLPSWFWEKLHSRTILYNTHDTVDDIMATSASNSNTFQTNLLMRVLCVFFLFYVFWWNVSNFPKTANFMPLSVRKIGYTLMLDQQWSMFGDPYENDGWIVVPGLLADGSVVDLFRDGAQLTWEKPLVVSETFKNYRWRKYLLSIQNEPLKQFRAYYLRYLCRTWNDAHEGGKRLASAEMVFIREKTLSNRTIAPPERMLKASHECLKVAL